MHDRFWAKVTPAPADQCWEWTAARDKGYGRFMYQGQPRGAHRMAWMLLRGDIPDGLTIEHECRNTGCVNPWHMDLWPNVKNAAGAINQYRDRTHCSHDHEYTPDNTAIRSRPNGKTYRSCRTCEANNLRRRRAR